MLLVVSFVFSFTFSFLLMRGFRYYSISKNPTFVLLNKFKDDHNILLVLIKVIFFEL